MVKNSSFSNGVFELLECHISNSSDDIEQWFQTAWKGRIPPIYSSVDLRNAGFKIVPVDTNLFPAGFNNLSEEIITEGSKVMREVLRRFFVKNKNILIVPENHTRNKFYLKNLQALVSLLEQADCVVRLGSWALEYGEPVKLEVDNHYFLTLEPILRDGNRIGLAGFDPSVILLNNDLSSGVPSLIQYLDEQAVFPPVSVGWTTRRKSSHFKFYSEVAKQFSEHIKIDPWTIDPYWDYCEKVDFQNAFYAESLADQVATLLARIREKYDQYNITKEPYVVLKANSGTYGMGVMTVKDPTEVLSLNRKQRNKMSVVKDGLPVTSLFLQEGVFTIESVGTATAEPVLYMIDCSVMGGFYRSHPSKKWDQNLNAPGMHFSAFPEGFFNISVGKKEHFLSAPVDRFYVYSVIARLAALAASLEMKPLEESSLHLGKIDNTLPGFLS